MLYSILVENHEKIKLSKTNTSDRGKVFFPRRKNDWHAKCPWESIGTPEGESI